WGDRSAATCGTASYYWCTQGRTAVRRNFPSRAAIRPPRPSSRVMSPRPCGAFVEERHDSRSGEIAGFQPIDSKASIGKQIIDLTVQVTPAREPHPERIEAILPTRDAGFRRAAMLHEQQTSADFEH